jgi:hypothetical protein
LSHAIAWKAPDTVSCIVTVNVAHPPLSGADAEKLLDETLRSMRASSTRRVLKIIHGYGSSGKGGTLRETVRNWCFRRRSQVLAVIPGEDATPYDARTQEVAQACGVSAVADLGPANDGMTILWVA